MLQNFLRAQARLLPAGQAHWQYAFVAHPARRRFFASGKDFSIAKTRNIGIIAHIDAGKTTTTERMLYYAGVTKRIGDIDDGDTVMDYLKAERERGITINSASITFGWDGHRINLIDTPGHVDFTMEVERAVRVLDGAVTVLDGVAGVEAQTETVWHQANRYTIPRIAFVNKMDRTGAAFGRTVKEMWKKLQCRPLVIQIPIMVPEGEKGDRNSGIRGVVDLVTMEVVEWLDVDGMQMKRTSLVSNDHPDLYEEAVRGRTALIESLAEIDDGIVEVFFEEADGDHLAVPSEAIKASLRRMTLANKAVPVLCGSAFKNLGVQPVLDAVVDYLPSPAERPSALATLSNGKTALVPLAENGKLCALAFKVTHDPRRGPLVYVKVYSGKVNTRMTLYNTTTDRKERVNKLLQMYAKDVEEIPSIDAGNIGVIVGLKDTRTGDTLVQSNDTAAIKSGLQLGNIDIPSPAFFSAVEPASVSEEPIIEEALKNLTREDPSLSTWVDPESGQMLVSGMGELHLEIVRDRLINDFKCKMDMGKMHISYRETCQDESSIVSMYNKEVMGKRAKAQCQIEVAPVQEDTTEEGWVSEQGALIRLELDAGTKDNTEQTSQQPWSDAEIRQAVHTGIVSGLARGAVLGFPLTRIKVKVSDLTLFGQDSTLGAISGCVANGILDAVKQAGPCLLEPMMEVNAQVNEAHIGGVVSDLSGTRRGHIISLESPVSEDGDDVEGQSQTEIYVPSDPMLNHSEIQGYAPKQIIKAHVPLSSMLGYSSVLRSLTGGSGSFTMRVIGYGEMTKDREQSVIKEMRGY